MIDEARRRLLPPLVVFLLAFSFRLSYHLSVRDTLLEDWHLWEQSDMATYVEQARRIAEGDLLGRDPYRPYHVWQTFAPEERWLGWYPPRAFHQAPGYSYLLAGFMRLGGDWIERVRVFQCLCGAATATFVLLLARRTGGALAGWSAGLVCAFYAPLVLTEHQLLREAPTLSLLVAGMYLLHRSLEEAADRCEPPSAWRLAGVGAIFGATTLFHESGQVVLAGAALGVAIEAFRRRPPEPSSSEGPPGRGHRPHAPALKGARAGAILLAGALAVLSPWAIRNAIVGAPLSSLSSRTIVVLAMSNLPEADEGGSVWSSLAWKDDPAPIVAALDYASGSPVRMLAHLARRNAERPLDFLEGLARKIRAAFAPREAPDNISVAFMRGAVPGLVGTILLLAPGYGWIFAPAMAGLFVLLRRRDRPGNLSIAVISLALLASLCIVHALGRLRLPSAVPSIVLFGLAVGALRDWLRENANRSPSDRWKRAFRSTPFIAGALAALFQVHARAHYGPDLPGSSEHVVMGNLASRLGIHDEAAAQYRIAVELGAGPDVVAALDRAERLARGDSPDPSRAERGAP